MTASAASPEHDATVRALEYFRSGRHQDAIAVCHERLAEVPDDPGAVHLLAQLLVHVGKGAVAVLLLEQALKSRPDEPALLIQLGSALATTGSTDAAAAAYERVLAQDPDNAEAHFGMADVGRMRELEGCLRAAARLHPNDPAPHFGLANVFLETGRNAAARESFHRAVGLDPKFRRRHASLGTTLATRNRCEAAARVYRWGLALNPSDPELRHLLLAAEGETGPDRAPDAYVVDYFDAFAESFDEVLLGSLDYRAPQIIVEALGRWLPRQARLSVLDAGCGTGLCGPLLRPFARRLVGIDLSAGMVGLAGASGAYDELRVGEIVAAMDAERQTYDLIVAADVLVYFGSLDELFRAMARALRPGGLAGLTVERHDGDGHALRPSGRYAHSSDYLRVTAGRAGLVALEVQECTCRLELGSPVAAYAAVLQAPVEAA